MSGRETKLQKTDVIREVLAAEEARECRVPFVVPQEPVIIAALPLRALQAETNQPSNIQLSINQVSHDRIRHEEQELQKLHFLLLEELAPALRLPL